MVKVLLFINVQHYYLEGDEAVPEAYFICDEIERLLHKARAATTKPVIIWVRDSSAIGDVDQPDNHEWELHYPVEKTEHVVDNRHNNVFEHDQLEPFVPRDAELYIAGMQSEYDLRSAGYTALERGNKVFLVRYAHGTFHSESRRAARISRDVELELEKKGARVIDVDNIVFDVESAENTESVEGAEGAENAE